VKIYSFFSGLGFLDLGFENTAGFDVCFANEIHRPFLDAHEFSRASMENSKQSTTARHCCSIENLAAKRNLFKSSNGASEPIGFIGGPPCPDFSIAGKQRGQHGDNGRLTRLYVELIQAHKPHWFLFENVKGLWSTKRHRTFYDEMVRKLIVDGYIVDDRLINALEYGAPQDRDRIILVGFHKRLLGKKSGGRLKGGLGWDLQMSHNRQAVFDAPWPTTNPFGGNPQLPKGCFKELTVEHWFVEKEVSLHPNYCHGFTPRAGLARFQTIEEGDDSKKSFKRLHRWRFSPTVAYGNNEVHLHPYEARRLRVSEALALQTLPTSYTLPDNMTLSNMFKGIGNGVPYVAASGLARMIKNHIENL